MRVIKINGLKPEFVDLNYNVIKEEMKRCKDKGKTDNVISYEKLLKSLEENSTPETIENEVNKIIDFDINEIKRLKEEVKKLEKEISLLSNFSERENDLDVLPTIIANI